MVTINRYLDNILCDFKEYVNSGVELCDLKDVHYDAGKVPDYSDIHVQQLYLLRYAYAYAFEYKQMYRSLIHRIVPDDRIAVTSIGCGSMIDYWSLAHSVPQNCVIRYRGVDKIDWSYLIDKRPQDDICFIEGDVVDIFQRAYQLTADAYIFPKSISEFSRSDIESMCKSLGEKTPKNKKVYILFSLRTDERSMDRDLVKTNQVFQAMKSNGFISKDNPNTYSIIRRELQGKKICEVDSDFHHPWDTVNFIVKELHTCCAHYDGENCKPDCKSRLGRFPILTCHQACWQLFEFVKEE